jgi:hypothetical protein
MGIGVLTATAGASTKTQAKSTVATGINVQFYDYGFSKATLTKDAKAVFSYVKTLGANSVAITIPFQVPSTTSNSIVSAVFTPSPTNVGLVVGIAVADKLKVMLRPMVDETNIRPSWRGDIVPSNPTKWFTNYGAFLKPYLQMAQKDKVTSFDLATELQGTYKFSGWGFFVTAVKAWFKGTIIVSDSWTGPNLSAIAGAQSGIDAYDPIAASNTASVATVLADWNANLSKTPYPSLASNTVITEVAIPSQNGAYAQPNSYNIKNEAINSTIQSTWFTAACQFVQKHKFAGLYFWRLDLPEKPTQTATKGSPLWFTSATVKEIKTCFKTTL